MTVKIYLTDICTRCCPETINAQEPCSAMTERVKAAVYSRTGLRRRKTLGKRTKVMILVAAMVSLFVSSAFALGRYFMEHEALENGGVSGYRTVLDQNGEILEQEKKIFPDAGILLSFQGVQERPNIPEFRCLWLPEEANVGTTDSEGWTMYLANIGEGENIPYIISSKALPKSGNSFVLNGEVTVVKEEYWGEWYVLQMSTDYTNCKLRWPCERANYILIFDEQSGFIVTIVGVLKLETLEKIARNIEIRDSGKALLDDALDSDIGQIDIGRG